MDTAGGPPNTAHAPPDLALWDGQSGFGFISASDGVPDGGHFGVIVNAPGSDCMFTGFAVGPDV